MSNDRLLLVANNGAMVAEGSATDDFIKSRIFTIRGVQVMLDRDLAVLYGIETRALNQAVKRNADRFPPDLMFQVETAEVINALEPSEPQATPSRSQFVTLNKGRAIADKNGKPGTAGGIQQKLTNFWVPSRRRYAKANTATRQKLESVGIIFDEEGFVTSCANVPYPLS